MELVFAYKTDVGKKREHNEDSYGCNLQNQLFFVCDGMGGHAAGDYASQMAVSTINDLSNKGFDEETGKLDVENDELPDSGRKLVAMAMMANRRLFNMAVVYPKLRGMGTTMTSIKFDKGFLNVVNVGDSRVYRLRDGLMKQLTVDHTWVEELLEDGEIAENELDAFEKKNVITRAVGTNPSVAVDWKACEVEEGDIYLLCSDGLYGEINDDKISSILIDNKENLTQASAGLVDAANAAGGSDNITVVLVKVKGKIEEADSSDDFLPELNIQRTYTIDEKQLTLYDSYITKNYPPSTTMVPDGVEKESRKFYENLFFRAIVIVMVVLGIVIFIKKPWAEKTRFKSNNINYGDILVRTRPAGAVVTLYSDGVLKGKKFSPADFLALQLGEYKIEISKSGYEPVTLDLSSRKGMQEIKMIELNEMKKIDIVLGLDPDFNLDSLIYLDGKPIQYYGANLTIRQIGMVGKVIPAASNMLHKIKVENAEREFKVDTQRQSTRITLNKGWIFVNEEDTDKKRPEGIE